MKWFHNSDCRDRKSHIQCRRPDTRTRTRSGSKTATAGRESHIRCRIRYEDPNMKWFHYSVCRKRKSHVYDAGNGIQGPAHEVALQQQLPGEKEYTMRETGYKDLNMQWCPNSGCRERKSHMYTMPETGYKDPNIKWLRNSDCRERKTRIKCHPPDTRTRILSCSPTATVGRHD